VGGGGGENFGWKGRGGFNEALRKRKNGTERGRFCEEGGKTEKR